MTTNKEALDQVLLDGQQNNPLNEVSAEENERKLREEHLLDVAAVLLVRWGYRKTTIDDVAREAGVGKGTIYLHWKGKSELFRAAIIREQQRVSAEVKQRVAADPEGGLAHRQWAHTFIVASANPLMAAILKGQTDIFQGLLSSIDQKTMNQMVGDADSYIVRLQNAGLIRTDLSVPVIIYLMTALKVGFISATDIISQDRTPPLEQLTEALSDLLRRWLSPDQLPSDTTEGKRVLDEWLNNVQKDIQQS
jgi:AcrR family transcriptional regulator